jgi:hypothetical protein
MGGQFPLGLGLYVVISVGRRPDGWRRATGRSSCRIRAMRPVIPVVMTIIARILQLRTVCRFAQDHAACKRDTSAA